MVMPEGKHDLKKVIQSLQFSSNKYQIYEYFTLKVNVSTGDAMPAYRIHE